MWFIFSPQSIWTFFAENSISHSALVALFYHFVQTVHKKNVSVQYREYGLHAAGLYFLLLEVPGMYIWYDRTHLLSFTIFLHCFELLYFVSSLIQWGSGNLSHRGALTLNENKWSTCINVRKCLFHFLRMFVFWYFAVSIT